jgi:hypothetical protein
MSNPVPVGSELVVRSSTSSIGSGGPHAGQGARVRSCQTISIREAIDDGRIQGSAGCPRDPPRDPPPPARIRIHAPLPSPPSGFVHATRVVEEGYEPVSPCTGRSVASQLHGRGARAAPASESPVRWSRHRRDRVSSRTWSERGTYRSVVLGSRPRFGRRSSVREDLAVSRSRSPQRFGFCSLLPPASPRTSP